MMTVNDFVPRLTDLHAALDRAVCDAYGWEYAALDDEEQILRRLLAFEFGGGLWGLKSRSATDSSYNDPRK